MKIYTKTGDLGETALFGGPRVTKNDLRVEAYGEVDELNASLGVVRAYLEDPEIDRLLAEVQGELFALGAELATPHEAKARGAIPPLDPLAIGRLETSIDRWDEELPALTNFILPGGTRTSAALHLSRCVCRRAERRVVALTQKAIVHPDAVRYLNRLSDFLFVAARVVNHRSGRGETPWQKGRGQG